MSRLNEMRFFYYAWIIINTVLQVAGVMLLYIWLSIHFSDAIEEVGPIFRTLLVAFLVLAAIFSGVFIHTFRERLIRSELLGLQRNANSEEVDSDIL